MTQPISTSPSKLNFPPKPGKTITPVPGFPGLNVHSYDNGFFIEEVDIAFSRSELTPEKRKAVEALIREKFPLLSNLL